MKDEKLTIAKRKVYQAVKNLDLQQVKEIEKYVRKIQGKKSVKQRKERKQKQFEDIRTLQPGTKVICSSSQEPDFDGQTGIIIRHLGRGSIRTVVEFDNEINNSTSNNPAKLWHIPSIWLSKATPEKVKQVREIAQLNQGLGKFLTKALNNMEK